ncbi:MAG: hypothetical protein HQ541_20955 [Mariniphaga sp.]|nr:hypothetical protein [Mariniphaga sp.]
MKKVADVISVSTNMLNRFLSVKKLNPEVQKLFYTREIDNINLAYYIKNLNFSDQLILAKKYASGEMNSQDIRVLMPLRKINPDSNIIDLCEKVMKSKNIKIYIAQFEVLAYPTSKDTLTIKFEKLIGKKNLYSISLDNNTCTLKVTKTGEKQLREIAKSKNKSLQSFLNSI